MQKYYLLRPDGTYSDAGEYPAKPANRSDGTWTAGEPQGLDAYTGGDVNTRMDLAFRTLLPAHIGQAYLTDIVIDTVIRAKVAVVEANRVDPSGEFARAVITRLTLPVELESARTQLLGLLP